MPESKVNTIGNQSTQKALKLLLSKILINEAKNEFPTIAAEWADKTGLH